MANPMTALDIPLLDTLFAQLPRLQWSASELHEHRRAELTATVALAKAESRWHATRLAHIDVNALDPSDLSALPTMTKRDLMANWDDVVTDGRLTLVGAREHLREVERSVDRSPASAKKALTAASHSKVIGDDGVASQARNARVPAGVIEYTVRVRAPVAVVCEQASPRDSRIFGSR